MNKIIFPLEGDQQGPAVADLQDTLQLFMAAAFSCRMTSRPARS